MSHWDSTQQKIVRWPTEPVVGYPGWFGVDCGCCAGIEWGGETPETCDRCGGSGMIFVHAESLRTAEYPGGRLTGSLAREDARLALPEVIA